jgi:hypothetical protein
MIESSDNLKNIEMRERRQREIPAMNDRSVSTQPIYPPSDGGLRRD